MAARYGNGNKIGRRQYDDTPLSDAPLVSKGFASSLKGLRKVKTTAPAAINRADAPPRNIKAEIAAMKLPKKADPSLDYGGLKAPSKNKIGPGSAQSWDYGKGLKLENSRALSRVVQQQDVPMRGANHFEAFTESKSGKAQLESLRRGAYANSKLRLRSGKAGGHKTTMRRTIDSGPLTRPGAIRGLQSSTGDYRAPSGYKASGIGKGLLSTGKVASHGHQAQVLQEASTKARHLSQNAANHADRLGREGGHRASEAKSRTEFASEQYVRSGELQARSDSSAKAAVKEAKRVRNTAAAVGVGGGAATSAAGATAVAHHKSKPQARKMKVYKGLEVVRHLVNTPAGKARLAQLSGKKNLSAVRHLANTPAGRAHAAKIGPGAASIRAEFGKTRSYDPEHRRQQGLGAATAVLGASGGYAGYRGVKGIAGTTKLAHTTTGISTKATGHAGQKAAHNKAVRDAVRSGIVGSKKNFALTAAGVAGLGGAAGVQIHANSRRGKAWD